LKKFHGYKNLPPMIITESGVCYPDELVDNRVNDIERVLYFKETLEYVHKAIQKDIDVRGFFAWTLTDNFEWSEGYFPRFGLVYIDYKTRDRFVKDSGYWFSKFLK
jgi:beta-glucosidase